MSIRFASMGDTVRERFRIIGGIRKITEVSDGDFAKNCQTDASGIIKRGFPKVVITEKYLTINGLLSKIS